MPRAYTRVLLFFLVTYALTWVGNLGNYLWPSDAWPRPMNPLGPLVAAPLVLWLYDGGPAVAAWFRRILRFRAPPWLYATAFLLPLAIILGSVGLAIAIGTKSGPLPSYAASEFIIGIPIVLLFGPLPEEPGFRGLGLHELRDSMTTLTAALIIGLGVLIWHLPLFLTGDLPLPIAVVLPAVSVVYAWLYTRGGSVWPLVLAHWVQNYFGGNFFGMVFAPPDQWIWLSFLTVAYLLWAALLVWRYGPELGR